ncbi:hypothetical protein ACEPAI_4467 [Sanghuangporus weigelae]
MSTTVNVDFTNTGDGIVTISFTDHLGRAVAPIIIRPNQIIRQKLEINFSYNFTYGKGRDEKNAAQTFSNNATVDVNKYFV